VGAITFVTKLSPPDDSEAEVVNHSHDNGVKDAPLAITRQRDNRRRANDI